MGFIDSVIASMEKVTDKDARHFGRKGMRWGVTTLPDGSTKGTPVAVKAVPGKAVKTSGGKGVKPSEDAIKVAEKKQIAKKSTTDALSNQELQAVVTRMQLEANYSRLAAQTKSPGKQFIDRMLGNKKQLDSVLAATGNTEVPGQIKSMLKDAASVGDTISKTDLSKIGK